MKKIESGKKKVWIKPKLVVLDFKKTYDGPFQDPQGEVGSYHS